MAASISLDLVTEEMFTEVILEETVSSRIFWVIIREEVSTELETSKYETNTSALMGTLNTIVPFLVSIYGSPTAAEQPPINSYGDT